MSDDDAHAGYIGSELVKEKFGCCGHYSLIDSDPFHGVRFGGGFVVGGSSRWCNGDGGPQQPGSIVCLARIRDY